MQTEHFKLLADILKKQSGLALTPDKVYLLETRLLPVAKKWHVDSVDALAETIRLKHNDLQINDVVEAMTTNESLFFRDMKPFELFTETMLPYLKQARGSRRTIRIWSAASSSGQEAYSLAMLLKERGAEFANWTIEIVGTDLSHEMINHANAGLYSHFEVQRGLPARMMVKYFKQDGDHWRISDDIRRMVHFKPWNLLHNLAGLGQFDIVFCRNVLIYFDKPTKAQVLGAIARQMPSDGFLVLGGAETVLGVTSSFVPVSSHPGLYTQPVNASPLKIATN